MTTHYALIGVDVPDDMLDQTDGNVSRAVEALLDQGAGTSVLATSPRYVKMPVIDLKRYLYCLAGDDT